MEAVRWRDKPRGSSGYTHKGGEYGRSQMLQPFNTRRHLYLLLSLASSSCGAQCKLPGGKERLLIVVNRITPHDTQIHTTTLYPSAHLLPAAIHTGTNTIYPHHILHKLILPSTDHPTATFARGDVYVFFLSRSVPTLIYHPFRTYYNGSYIDRWRRTPITGSSTTSNRRMKCSQFETRGHTSGTGRRGL